MSTIISGIGHEKRGIESEIFIVSVGSMKSCQLRAIPCQVAQKMKRATTLE